MNKKENKNGKYDICRSTRLFFLYRCTVHFDIYKVHTPTNALFIKLDKVLKIYIKNHFKLLLHVSVFKHDHHQGTFIRA